MSDITAAPSGTTAGSANRALRGPHHLASTRKPRPIQRGPRRDSVHAMTRTVLSISPGANSRARIDDSLLHAEQYSNEGGHR